MPEFYSGPSVVHVGYLKTATTFLQNQVFSRGDLGLGLAGGEQSRAYMVEKYIVEDDYDFDAKGTRTYLDARERPQREAGLLPVWSEEAFLGDPTQRQYLGPQVARKLAQTHGGAIRILVTIREQSAMALSAYREYVRWGGRNPLSDFIGPREPKLSFSPIMKENFLRYDRAVNMYISLFGAENLLVLPIEMLCAAPGRYLDRLGGFLGLDLGTVDTGRRDNKGCTMAAVGLNRRLNSLLVHSPLDYAFANPWDRAVQAAVKIFDRIVPDEVEKRQVVAARATIAARYAKRFEESNRTLEALTGLDLKALGYQ